MALLEEQKSLPWQAV
ncbi:hypothetical protein ACUOFC_64690, partial [Escherichia sp. TWPC-MK]